jgi:hypothetical protein
MVLCKFPESAAVISDLKCDGHGTKYRLIFVVCDKLYCKFHSSSRSLPQGANKRDFLGSWPDSRNMFLLRDGQTVMFLSTKNQLRSVQNHKKSDESYYQGRT